MNHWQKKNPQVASPGGLGEIRRLTTAELFLGRSRIEIDHQGATYRMQITRQGKLILTK